jgi:hypothetical protein
MPITKARLDRMIDMIDSAWLKRRDSEGRNTDPKQFNEGAPRQPQPDQELWPPKPRVPVPIETL